MAAHRSVPYATAATMTSTGLSIPWCCTSTIYVVFLCDNYHSLFIVEWSSAAYHDVRYDRTRTMIACEAWRLSAGYLAPCNMFSSWSQWMHGGNSKTRRPTNWWGSAKRGLTYPTATVVYRLILAITCSENIRALPWIDSNGRVDNNTTSAKA